MRKVLISAIVILSLLLAAMLGFIWYQGTHFFVEDTAYAKYAKELDLRGEDISEGHYLAVRDQLPNCSIFWDVPFQGTKYANDTTRLTLNSLTEEDIRVLEAYFPTLQQIDASGCREYVLLAELAQRLPYCKVIYRIDLGGTAAEPDARELTLPEGSFDYDLLMTNLVHLPELEALHFPKTGLTNEQQQELTQTYPELAVSCTVEVLGKEYDVQTTVLDLSAMTSGDVEAVAAKLGMLPSLTEVQLMPPSGESSLTLQDVSALKQSAPEVVFHYSFGFYGLTISTSDEEVLLKNLKLEGENFKQDLGLLLEVMEDCKRVVVDAIGPYDKIWKQVSNEELAQLREEYRDKTKLVWRIYFGDGGSCLTDVEVLRAVYGLVDDNSSALQYLEDLRYMDIGHNDMLDYADFVSGMKSLEAVIISGAPIKSLEPFAACKNLKFLEMANCGYVPDLEPLKECTQLEMLNISFTKISDLSALDELNLTHLNSISNEVSEEDLEAYMEAHPDCWTVIEGNHYGVGWRYAEDNTLLDWYAKLDEQYHYISQKNIPNNSGWYLPEEE